MPSLLLRLTNTLFKVIDKGLFGPPVYRERKEDDIETEKEKPCPRKSDLELIKVDAGSSNTAAAANWATEQVAAENTFPDKKVLLKSERDLEEYLEKQKSVKSESEKAEQKGPLQEQSCVICCDKPADAVLLPCGHGGLCFDCGKKLGRQCGDCYLCRKVLIFVILLIQTKIKK